MKLSQQCFAFEADFTADLRCIPMAVRRKLDLAGVKLKLAHWSELQDAERERLLNWNDDPEAIGALRAHLLQRTATLKGGKAGSLRAAVDEPWQQSDDWPQTVLASCRQMGLELKLCGWKTLNELQRFALVKLSHPGHEHRNLTKALVEFDLLAGSAG